MQISIYFLIYFGVILCTAGSISFIKRQWGATAVYLSPITILILAYVAYTSAMPFSVLFFGETLTELDIYYMRDHFLGSLGLLLGVLAGKFFDDKQSMDMLWARATADVYVRPVTLCILISLIYPTYLATVFHGVGGDLRNILSAYGAEREFSKPTGSGLSLLLLPTLFATLQVANYSIFTGALRNKIIVYIILFLSISVVTISLLRGSRNTAMIFMLPLLILFFRNKAIPLVKIILVSVIAVFLLYTHAFVRNWGFGRISEVNVELSAFAPVNGELGTSHSVYMKSYGLVQELEWGKTYYQDAIVNLIPRAIWPNRPPSTAEKFSLLYFNVDELAEGLGFAPIVEAKINFGTAGILPIFTITALGIYYLQRKIILIPVIGPLIFATMGPIAFNWNRIDSNVVLKFFVIYGGMAGLIAVLSLGRRRRQRPNLGAGSLQSTLRKKRLIYS